MYMMDILSPELSEVIKQSHLISQEEKKRTRSVLGQRPLVRESLQDGKFISFVHMSDATSPNQPDSSQSLVVYNVRLERTTGQSRFEQLRFWTRPKTVLDVKRQAEKQFDVPVSLQTVKHKDRVLKDNSSLADLSLSDKSVLEIHYFSVADREEVWTGYRWFEFINRLHLGCHSNIWTGLPAEVEYVVTAGLREGLPQKLAGLLRPIQDKCRANREYFIQLGGIKIVVSLYEQLCLEDWRCLPLHLKMVETGCILVLSAMTTHSTLASGLTKTDSIGFVERSFLRVRIRRGVALRDVGGAPGRQEHNDFLAVELIKTSLEFMVGVRHEDQLPEDMYSSTDLLEQLINVGHCPSFSHTDAQSSVCVIGATLWYCDARLWITKSSILEGVCDMVKARRRVGGKDEEELVVLDLFVQIFLATVISTSSLHLNRRMFDKLIHTMEAFLSQDTTSILAKRRYYTFNPLGENGFHSILKLLYPSQEDSMDRPHLRYSKEERDALRRLSELSEESVLFMLEVMVESDPHWALHQLQKTRDQLEQFFLCLPFRLPERLRERGRKVVRLLYAHKRTPVPMPKLEGLARSFLARNYFGLRGIAGRSPDAIHAAAYPSRKSLKKPKFKDCAVFMKFMT